MTPHSDRAKGLAITALGVFILSPDSLLIRLIDADAGTVTAWRGGFSFLALALWLLWRDGRAAFAAHRRGSWPEWAVSILFGSSTYFFVAAINNTTAANVLVTIAAAPIMAALLGRAFLGERLSALTWGAIAIGLLGVGIAGQGGLAASGAPGIGFALVTAFSLAVQFTVLRRAPGTDNVAAIAVGALISSLIGCAVGDPLSLPADRFIWAALVGLIVSPVSFALITYGPRFLSGAEVSLIMLLETALGPLWVWAFLHETPGRSALIGGAVVACAVAMMTIPQTRGKRPGGA